ncbi:MAG: PQQ-binding-like beta-propeller repeat protein [Candidatus Bathyarchaeota archaeon]|nr:PQQ-binding-like beta-propeller repeat protein [Candidatus Bathyarchaeota archaeon]
MLKQKSIPLIIATILMVSMVISIVPSPLANAQSSGEFATYAYISVAPNPIGVGQTTYISVWVDVPLPSATEANDVRRHNYKLTITAPDNTTEVKTWNIIWDTTGVEFTSFTPTQLGTYTLKFEYPGQTYTWGSISAAWNNTKFLASSASTTLTVQEEPISGTPVTPLPTEYWSRPIFGQNHAWAQLGSHWLWGAQFGVFQMASYNLWQQSGVGPESSHIMWTYPIESGGVVGGNNVGIDESTYYSGGSYEGRFANAIIIDGKLCFKLPLSNSQNGGDYIAMDLRTGKELWRNATMNPTFGELYSYESINQHGVIPNGYLWQTVTQSAGLQTWMAIDPLTGKWIFNLTDVPSSGTMAYTEKGEIVKYILSYSTTSKTGWIALWNWTAAPGAAASAPGSGSGAFQFRPVGKNINCSTAYSWNKTFSGDLVGNQAPSIVYVLPGDIILGRSSAITAGVFSTRGTPDPYTVWAMSVKDGQQGQILWKKSYPAPSGNMSRTLGPLDPVNRVWTMTDAESMQWLGYSLENGNLIWGPTSVEKRAMQFFASGYGAGQRAVTAYGNLYEGGFGGELFAYDAATGKLLWKYNNTNAGTDNSWGLTPIFIAAIADGKVYAFNNEHSPNAPLYKGECVYIINATDGTEISKMLGWAGQSGGPGSSTSILADGFFVYYNYYDNSIYCMGKGPSKTTVEAPMAAVTLGSSIVIRGTVTDISPGTKQSEQAARFPNGVPAVSDASVNRWMEYVYMQQPCPSDATGVPVQIFVVDGNGNYRSIGTATSDATGFYSLQWKPDIPGKYTVYAQFMGSASYWPSQATTAFAVDDAPEPTAAPTPAPASMVEQYFLPSVAAIIIAIIAIGVVIILLVRKK